MKFDKIKPQWRKLSEDYNSRWKKGMRVQIDAVRFDPNTRSGIALRVVNIWKRPAWMDVGWFTPKSIKGHQ